MNKNRLFITGIPTAGKSYLGKKLAEEVGGICVSIDGMREDLAKDERYGKWVNFYLKHDEYTYYTTTSYDEQWKNLVAQSEGLWPGILEGLRKYDDETRPVIFEGVNILPHLAHRDLHIPGIAIIGRSFEETLDRNIKDPRWGLTEDLQKLEAEAFFNVERPHYEEEARKYGYQVFETPDEAWVAAIKILTSGSSTIKTDSSHTTLDPYSAKWVDKYKAESAKLEKFFGEKMLVIEHIGSTAIPGAYAKPIIDIAVLIENHESAGAFIKPLEEIGYKYDEPASSTERHFFRKGNPTEYHLSICYKSRGGFLRRQILFRDYLINHPEAREEYSALKQSIIKKDPTGKNSYIGDKGQFVNEILKKAGFV